MQSQYTALVRWLLNVTSLRVSVIKINEYCMSFLKTGIRFMRGRKDFYSTEDVRPERALPSRSLGKGEGLCPCVPSTMSGGCFNCHLSDSAGRCLRQRRGIRPLCI